MGVQPYRAFHPEGPPLGLILVTVLKLLIIFKKGPSVFMLPLAPKLHRGPTKAEKVDLS